MIWWVNEFECVVTHDSELLIFHRGTSRVLKVSVEQGTPIERLKDYSQHLLMEWARGIHRETAAWKFK